MGLLYFLQGLWFVTHKPSPKRYGVGSWCLYLVGRVLVNSQLSMPYLLLVEVYWFISMLSWRYLMYLAPPPKNFGKNVEGVFSKLWKGFWGRVKRIFSVTNAVGRSNDNINKEWLVSLVLLKRGYWCCLRCLSCWHGFSCLRLVVAFFVICYLYFYYQDNVFSL